MSSKNSPALLINKFITYTAHYEQSTYTVSQKQVKLFLLQLRQTFTKCDNFWHKDSKRLKL